MLNELSRVLQVPGIDVTDLDGEKVMMNLEKGKYFSMNSIGSRIWDIIENRKSIEEIIDILLREYDIDKETCRKSVISYLEELENAELITVL